jgi:hypothetical protein
VSDSKSTFKLQIILTCLWRKINELNIQTETKLFGTIFLYPQSFQKFQIFLFFTWNLKPICGVFKVLLFHGQNFKVKLNYGTRFDCKFSINNLQLPGDFYLKSDKISLQHTFHKTKTSKKNLHQRTKV